MSPAFHLRLGPLTTVRYVADSRRDAESKKNRGLLIACYPFCDVSFHCFPRRCFNNGVFTIFIAGEEHENAQRDLPGKDESWDNG